VDVGIADLNGDGALDVVLLDADTAGPRLLIYLNTGPNTGFSAATQVALAGGITQGLPTSMALGLINPASTGGLYDCAVARTAGSPVTDVVEIYQGTAGPTFSATPFSTINLPNSSGVCAIMCADPHKSSTDVKQSREDHNNGSSGIDMNGDGKTDLIVALQVANKVQVLCQSPTTPYQFSASSTVPVGTGCENPQMLCLADLSNHGMLDVVVGSTSRPDYGCSTTAGTVTVADASITANDWGRVITGPGIPNTVPQVTITGVTPGVGCTISAQATATVAGVTFFVHSDDVTILQGNGGGGVAFVSSYNVVTSGFQQLTGITNGDFNHDCRDDIITSNVDGENVAVYLGHGDSTLAKAVPYNTEPPGQQAGANIVSICHSPDFTSLFSLDNNTGPAFGAGGASVVTFVQRQAFLLAIGQPVAPPYVQVAVQTDPQGVAVGDLNRDGHPDIVVSNRASGTIMVFLNDGTGNFTAPYAPIPTGVYPEGIAIADVNNDGLNDVLVACNGSDQVAIHLNLGGGSLANATFVNVNASGPHLVATADMRNTGFQDFVTVNQYDNSVSVFDNDGAGNFTADPDIATAGGLPTLRPAGTYAVGNQPLGLVVADLNNDGKIDIATCNASDDTVSVLLRDGSTNTVIILSSTTYSLTGGVAPGASLGNAPGVSIGTVEPVSMAAGDLNGDGLLDLAVVGKSSNTVTILHNGGKKPFGLPGLNPGNPTILPAPNTPVQPGVFCVPTDYRHYGSNVKIGQPPVILPVGNNPVSVAIADMNDDGLLDIIVGSTNTGNQVMDYINQGSPGPGGLSQTAGTGLAFGTNIAGVPNPTNPPGTLNVITQDPDVVNSPNGETNFNSFNPKYPGPFVTFTAGNGATPQPVSAMALGGFIIPCVPQVATTAPDNNLRVFKTQ
jgi:hypothetical protein